jgi:ribosomal protein L11 methyltransferase
MSSYFRVRLIKVPTHLEDILTTLTFEYAASGVSEALAYTQPDLTYDPDLLPVRFHDLDVYFPLKPSEEFFEKVKELDGRIQSQVFEEENKDWL